MRKENSIKYIESSRNASLKILESISDRAEAGNPKDSSRSGEFRGLIYSRDRRAIDRNPKSAQTLSNTWVERVSGRADGRADGPGAVTRSTCDRVAQFAY